MFDLGLSAALMRNRTGIPLVTTIHTVIRHSQAIFNLVLFPADRLFLRRLVINKSDQLICPDFNIKRYSQDAFGRSDSIIVPYGIDNMSAPDESNIHHLREVYKVAGKRIILSLGHVHAIRNRQDLIAALPDVLRSFPNVVLLIVGAVTTTLPERLARSLGVEQAVVFTGPVSHRAVPELLALADLEAHWLNQEEPERTSLGIASLEAMLAGKVVLAAANPDTYGPGLLKNNENIIIVEPGKPVELAHTIIELLKDDERRREIGHRAQKTIQDHFSWDSICSQTIQVYRAAIEKDNKAGV
jgi:glycosyltransferase involved in cell wall biosynthesis